MYRYSLLDVLVTIARNKQQQEYTLVLALFYKDIRPLLSVIKTLRSEFLLKRTVNIDESVRLARYLVKIDSVDIGIVLVYTFYISSDVSGPSH
jgi:hypothetical protein